MKPMKESPRAVDERVELGRELSMPLEPVLEETPPTSRQRSQSDASHDMQKSQSVPNARTRSHSDVSLTHRLPSPRRVFVQFERDKRAEAPYVIGDVHTDSFYMMLPCDVEQVFCNHERQLVL